MPEEIELDNNTYINILTDDDVIKLHQSLSSHFSLLEEMEPMVIVGR